MKQSAMKLLEASKDGTSPVCVRFPKMVLAEVDKLANSTKSTRSKIIVALVKDGVCK